MQINAAIIIRESKMHIAEKEICTPVSLETDICVIGGSCTGVFAAVRAARLGAKVAIVEKQNSFGGVATQGLVNIWHSLKDAEFKNDIVAGLTLETIERLEKRGAVTRIPHDENRAFVLNTEELKIELDEFVKENGIVPFLHSFFVAPHLKDGKLDSAIIENKSGRSAIRAKIFIDASGDGDLAARLGLPFELRRHLQPPTTCSRILGTEGLDMGKLIREHREEFGLADDWGWRSDVAGIPGMTMHAETHVFNANCADADELSMAEIEGRRQIRAYMDIVRKYTDRNPVLANLASCIGIRETRHINCAYRLTEMDLLEGKKFDDAIANSSYRIDIHHEDRPGISFRYLDGTEKIFENGKGWSFSRWRPERAENPRLYQIPFRSMIPGKYENLMVCGRSIDCDSGSFGAARVMVTCNQTGEAAGVAAALAAGKNCGINKLEICEIRKALSNGGSIIH